MKPKIKYIPAAYLPKCDHCGSNIIPPEEHYFVSVEGNHHSDVRIVHRECYASNRTYWDREYYGNSSETIRTYYHGRNPLD